jgi:uncharacterized protein
MTRAKRNRVLVALVILVVVGVPVLWRPLQSVGASAIIFAPNHGKPQPTPIPGELRVTVGPPVASLSVELMDAPQARGTIFVLHGIRADKEVMRGWGTMLTHAGFRAVLVDLRGHGRSTGDWLSYGVVESRDLSQVLDALEAKGLVAGGVGVMGTSYGAATAIEWAGVDPRIGAVVAIAPFASLRAVVPGYAPVPLPTSFVDGCIERAGIRAGFDPELASPMMAIAKTKAPVLLVHGKEDGRIPFWHSERIAAMAPAHSELVLVPDEGHESIMNDATGVIGTRAPAWFAAHLPKVN